SSKVPLTNPAKELLGLMRGLHPENVLTLTSANTLSQYFWHVATAKLKIEDITFYDSRHEAITSLIQILPIQVLAKVTGNKKLKIEDLTFHHSRHEAITRLEQILTIQDLAKVTGHKDLKALMKYYNPTVIELADSMNGN